MSPRNTSEFDVAIIGAGFAGLYSLHKLRDELGLTARVIETGAGPGTVQGPGLAEHRRY